MIVLELTEAEAKVLQSALARRVADMMKELVHTDERAVHAELKASYEGLDRLQQRVAGLVSTA